MHPDWARSLRDQCEAAGVPFLFKQWGEWIEAEEAHRGGVYVDDLQGRDGSKIVVRHNAIQYRVGKKASGRVLDGMTHDEFPISPMP